MRIWVLVLLASCGLTACKKPEAAAAPAPVKSGLLGLELTGALPFTGPNGGEVTAHAGEAARLLNKTCTTSQELFSVSDDLALLGDLNAKWAGAGYAYKALESTDSATAFEAVGANSVFGVLSPTALFLCEY